MKTGDGLSFKILREANRKRQELSVRVDDWSAAEWSNALAGEVGELCNLTKKLRRQMDSDPTPSELLPQIMDEMADIATYLDLLAMKLEIDLGGAIRQKWNAVSKRHGFKIRLDRME